ncbi:MAG: chemotaxis protein CheA [Clostridiales bacterium]|nr:chemotaxis protein CheA [Clostridiales bacterium]
MFIFETSQNLEQLEQIILNNEKGSCYEKNSINEIFRIMHTIKGSAAMMQFNNISTLAHRVEDLFFLIREHSLSNYDSEKLSDLLLDCVDYFKASLVRLESGDQTEEDSSALMQEITEFLAEIKKLISTPKGAEEQEPAAAAEAPKKVQTSSYNNRFVASFFFEDGCMMENIRAFEIVHKLEEFASEISYIPEGIMDSDSSIEEIRKKGFLINLNTNKSFDELEKFFTQQIFLKNLELNQLNEDTKEEAPQVKNEKTADKKSGNLHEASSIKETSGGPSVSNSIISVNVSKLDKLMDLMGELVISEAMVIYNQDLQGLDLKRFQKSSQQLQKITSEMQDLVMSIRMVPLATTLQKMNRIVRDMNKKLNKDVKLEIIGEQTEVDKNIVEHISDPLMHLIRNSVDHGIEQADERIKMGKLADGTVTLEAQNNGSDVLIMVRDDGKGLDKDKILKRAVENGLLTKPQNEMSDKEIFSLIFLPGFSTNEKITEYSGRGVGMDVVVKGIEEVGGKVSIESIAGVGTEFTMKFPLTLAIIEGMNIKVGKHLYTIPIKDIKEFFRPKPNDVFKDPNNNEMIMVRGNCYPVIKLHEYFHINPDAQELTDGIFIIAESGNQTVCLFADQLLGRQEVVVKAMPKYIKKVHGLSGCTLLGDGEISLILDIGGIIAIRSGA